MGNCVSVHKNPETKLAVQIHSPTEENRAKNEQNTVGQPFLPEAPEIGHVAIFRDLSNKEELFFDSYPWLESDCEDYYSVNGDLTPSRGNTPVHQKSFINSTQPDYMDSTPNSIPDPSPADMKKQLIEFFRESFSDPGEGDQNLHCRQEAKPITFDLPPKSTSPYESVRSSICSSERNPYRDSHPREEKSAQCCIPSLMRSLSFTERKKRLSATNTGGW